eukprot:TRINITY_DN3490_c0_g1_i1.p1 TRINITY_DN3490_c0_g1~~TRINITY_DN3490_c0_g1_i1.p1  ORF type:complete len:286 (+),score=41.73 TRINITY_DN3490_c0_g1_i1:264-1121(+)
MMSSRNYKTAGGGVLLTVAIVHMLPEVAEADEQSGIDYPLCYFFVVMGYLFILALEKVIFVHEHYPRNPEKHDRKETSGTSGRSKGEPADHESDNDSELDVQHNEDNPTPGPIPNVAVSPPHAHSPHTNSIATPLILLASLSIHSTLEGIVFGMQSDQSSALSLLIAILVHKPVETFTLGGIMIKERVSRGNYIFLSFCLSVVTPIGTAIGIGINQASLHILIFGGLKALTVGSFIYISTTEIIADEFHRHALSKLEKFNRLASFSFGVLFILVLEIWMSKGHDH